MIVMVTSTTTTIITIIIIIITRTWHQWSSNSSARDIKPSNSSYPPSLLLLFSWSVTVLFWICFAVL
jgi:hypothetical protein